MSEDNIIREYCKQIPILLSQSRLSFLIGAGCSKSAGLPLMDTLTGLVCEKLDQQTVSEGDKKVAYGLLAEIKDKYVGLSGVSIEDFLSEIQDIHAILQRQKTKGVIEPVYQLGEILYNINHTEILLHDIKTIIVETLGNRVTTIKFHREFCRTIHYKLKQGRERTSTPINYFILNYDTLIEDALALERVSFNDGFVGGSTAWWDHKRMGGEEFELGGKRELDARIYKLHGSIDWIMPEGQDFPMRIRSSLPRDEVIGSGQPVVIYPASIKYKETQNDPYAQMIASFRKYISVTDNHVLAILGYGFNDEHINAEVLNGIKASKGALSVVIFQGGDNLPKTLDDWLLDDQISPQILILGKRGIWKNGYRVLESSADLDWYRFERIIDILNGVI